MEPLARVWEFAVAVGTNWFWWVTAVLFLLDQLLSKNFWPRAKIQRLSELWPEENRHRFFKWLAAFGFIIASFLAFDHVNQELKTAKAQTALSSANRWEPLKPDEVVALRSEFRSMPKDHLNILCAFAGCYDLAEGIFSVLSDLNWTGTFEGSYFSNQGIAAGIQMDAYSKKNDTRRRIIEAIERATKGRLQIRSYEVTEPAPTPEIENEINLIIGRVR